MRLVAEFNDVVCRQNVRAAVGDQAGRRQAALADEVVAHALRFVRAAHRRLRGAQPLHAGVERPNCVDTLVDVAAASRVHLRCTKESVRRLVLHEVRRVLIALELEAIDATDVGKLNGVVDRRDR